MNKIHRVKPGWSHWKVPGPGCTSSKPKTAPMDRNAPNPPGTASLDPAGRHPGCAGSCRFVPGWWFGLDCQPLDPVWTLKLAWPMKHGRWNGRLWTMAASAAVRQHWPSGPPQRGAQIVEWTSWTSSTAGSVSTRVKPNVRTDKRVQGSALISYESRHARRG